MTSRDLKILFFKKIRNFTFDFFLFFYCWWRWYIVTKSHLLPRETGHMTTWSHDYVQSLITHCTLCWTFFTLSTSVLIETIIYRFRKNNYRQMPLRNVRHWTVDPTESTCNFIHRTLNSYLSKKSEFNVWFGFGPATNSISFGCFGW